MRKELVYPVTDLVGREPAVFFRLMSRDRSTSNAFEADCSEEAESRFQQMTCAHLATQEREKPPTT
jgi:hypothetical protein